MLVADNIVSDAGCVVAGGKEVEKLLGDKNTIGGLASEVGGDTAGIVGGMDVSIE